MFERPRHREILTLLSRIDASLFESCGAWFAGGTRIVLDLDEYRESIDVDFLCANSRGYADLRSSARRKGPAVLFADTDGLHFPREVRTDQYGIRFVVEQSETRLKMEIVSEGRIELASGESRDWSPVRCLARVDCFAEKLLANSDRWPDRQVLSRDLVDLAAMRRAWGPVPVAAWEKAEAAYGEWARRDLFKALEAFESNPDYSRRCFEGLNITDPGPIREGLDLLRGDL